MPEPRQTMPRILQSAAAWVVVSVCPVNFTPALAQPWDHLADGRAVIVVKEHHLAFPSRGYDAGNILFDWDSLKNRQTLPEVIDDPEKARAIFRRLDDVTVSIGVGPDRSLFWNMFDRELVRNVELGFSVGKRQGNCESWTADFARLRQFDVVEPSNSGWRAHPSGSSTVYTFAGAEVEGVRPGLRNLSCNLLSQCSSSICLAPDMSFGFSFSLRDFPEERWRELLRRVDSILTSVVEEDAGDRRR